MEQKLKPGPGGLRAALTRLEEVLIHNETPLSELGAVASSRQLPFLFHLELCTLIRTGPDAATGLLTPGRLLSIAQQAATRGLLPLASPGALRHTLHHLETLAHDAHAWDPARPLWWAPLPLPTPLETLWDGLHRHDETVLTLPPPTHIATAFAGTPETPPWLSMPSLLTPGFTRTLHEQLEAAYQGGRIRLEREKVGATGRLSALRTDSVCYLTGLEPDVLDAAPTLAALVQWGLHPFAAWLDEAFPGNPLFPPQCAMLARYAAPSEGYHPHVDNPGGPHDNGRTLTLVVYLNAPEAECTGGALALWAANTRTTAPPAAVVPARSGSATLFDARAVAHQVQPLKDGPTRWALTVWFNDSPQEPPSFFSLPHLTLTDVLLPVADPPLPPDAMLFHEINNQETTGEIVVRTRNAERPRIGLVSTVYRGGSNLDAWCRHHFALGVNHIVLIFDHLEEPQEAADAARLTAVYPPSSLTVWSGTETAAERWPARPQDQHMHTLLQFARSGYSSYAVSARQTLNASAALRAAQDEELGGALLNWLIHLDVDELLYLEGAGRGGATLRDHFAASSAAGLHRIRYINHELLLPHRMGAPPCFKLNPRLAATRLGATGWTKLVAFLSMAPTDPRPYFTGYHNGKSAVAVAFGAGAGGVHSWALSNDGSPARSRFIAGPSVLHFRYASPDAFRRKYLAIAASPVSVKEKPFEPAPAEVAAVDLILSLQRAGADEATIARRLGELHTTLTTFSTRDIELLEEARLLFCPDLEHLPLKIA